MEHKYCACVSSSELQEKNVLLKLRPSNHIKVLLIPESVCVWRERHTSPFYQPTCVFSRDLSVTATHNKYITLEIVFSWVTTHCSPFSLGILPPAMLNVCTAEHTQSIDNQIIPVLSRSLVILPSALKQEALFAAVRLCGPQIKHWFEL